MRTLAYAFAAWRAGAALLLVLAAQTSQAVPSFARQTKLDCASCHLSWPELTATGRQFKLSGYTWGERQALPVAAMIQVSQTATRKVDPAAPEEFGKERRLLVQEGAIFAAGKITDRAGVFAEWAYDAVERRGSLEALDLRYANRLGEGDRGLVYGLTLNNRPSLQDLYNTGLVWGFPFASSAVALGPNAELAIEGIGGQVAGLGAYGMWRNTLYAELAAYRTADKGFSVLRAGTNRAEAAALKGLNPYWRLALQREWNGAHSAMIGGFGMRIDRYPDNSNPSGPSDRFTDTGIDAQYQYLDPGDRHRLSAQASYVHEKQAWNATAQSNPSDTLRSRRAKATYYYDNKYGLSVGYFAMRGSADDALYNNGERVLGSAAGSPDNRGYIVELNYLPLRELRLVLQYTAYAKFNGAKTDYDGFGRNARDNNTVSLLGWWMF